MSDLTLTFLFTDIEGFTKRWEEHPDAMRDTLARHDALLRQAVAAHGGHVFKSVGDGCAIAFATAPAALAAALQAQRALQTEAWGPCGPLRVRMALHTAGPVWEGEGEGDGNYIGAPLNRVALLLDAAHGGQILLSGATQELTRGFLPEGASLRDLGEHRLKGLVHPERVYQLVTPDLPADFPALRTLDRLESARRLRVISLEILSLLDRTAILSQLTSELPAVFPAQSATLFLLDPTEGVYRQAHGEGNPLALSPKESLLLRRLHESGRPVSTYDVEGVSQEAVLASDWEMARRLGAVLWVPLMLWGRLIGVLALGAKASAELYTEEELDALCLIANEAAVALENAALMAERERQARLQQEVAIARSIQMSLLPPSRLRLKGYEVLSRSEPSTEVGGDFYNLFEVRGQGSGVRGQQEARTLTPDPSPLTPGVLGVLVGDVAGKGVPAALFMAVTTTLIQGQAQLLPSPAATLAAANAELYPKMRRSGGRSLFATAIYGALDLSQGAIRLANAGQTPPIHWPASGEPRYVRLTGVPLGALLDSAYEEAVIHLAPGDRLLFTTDGFIEDRNGAGEPVGYEGFLRQLASLDQRSGAELIEALFAGDTERGDPVDRDDRTLVLITVLQE